MSSPQATDNSASNSDSNSTIQSLLGRKPTTISYGSFIRPTTKFEYLPLNKYAKVLLMQGADMLTGDVVTHLSLQDWAEMNDARIWDEGQHTYLDASDSKARTSLAIPEL